MTMRAVQCKDYGDIDQVMTVESEVPVPSLFSKDHKNNNDVMLVKVLSVALAPGDGRVLSGLTRELQGPSRFPYIPGGDCCGIVLELPTPAPTTRSCNKNHKKTHELPVPLFAVGDRVACRFANKPMGALGEYALVSMELSAKVPIPSLNHISNDAAAALASAAPAIVLVEQQLKDVSKQRVLVLGCRGGVGAHLCQLLRYHGTSYIVGVSSKPGECLKPPIAVDECIDYTTTNVFELERFQQNKFDVIVDLSGFGYAALQAQVAHGNRNLVVKSAREGGRYLTTVPPVGPIFEIHSVAALMRVFVFPLLWNAFVSRYTWKRRILPKYTFGQGLPSARDSCGVTRALELMQHGHLRAVIDPHGPYPMTTEGVRAAFRNLESRHSFGKTVIQVCSSATEKEEEEEEEDSTKESEK